MFEEVPIIPRKSGRAGTPESYMARIVNLQV
jgi:hypothetical protein